MSALAFRVIGIAQSMGSKRAFVPKGWTRPVITDSNRNLKSWQSLVAEAAARAISARQGHDRSAGQGTEAWRLLDGPVRLCIAFYLKRPKGLPKKYVAHTKAPDVSKLVRSTEDALSGIVYRDDSQIVELVAGKYYAAVDDVPHCDIEVQTTEGARAVEWSAGSLPLCAEAG